MKNDCNFLKKWLQLKKCSHVTVIFDEFWPQLSTFCSHISNYDCNFQHFAVTFRIMTATFNILQSHFELWLQIEICSHVTATFNILQSHFELWLQLLTFCGHISNYDCKMLKFAVTFLILQSEMDFWNWWRGIHMDYCLK